MRGVNKMKAILTAAVFIAIYGYVSDLDYQDAMAAEAWYIDGFCKGYHPDYKNLLPNCEGQ
jgi:hypothetical protein